MIGKFLAGAAVLGSLVIAGDAFAANMWRTNHGHGGGGGGGTSANVSSNSGTTFNAGTNGSEGGSGYTGGPNGSEGGNGYTGGPNGTVGVPEPSSLYAVGSALALLGAAGWALRRKQ